MDVVDPTELFRGFRRVEFSTATTTQLRGVLDDIRRVRARFDGVEAEIARRLETASPTPERDIAASAQRSIVTAPTCWPAPPHWPIHRRSTKRWSLVH